MRRIAGVTFPSHHFIPGCLSCFQNGSAPRIPDPVISILQRDEVFLPLFLPLYHHAPLPNAAFPCPAGPYHHPPRVRERQVRWNGYPLSSFTFTFTFLFLSVSCLCRAAFPSSPEDARHVRKAVVMMQLQGCRRYSAGSCVYVCVCAGDTNRRQSRRRC